MTNNQPLWKPTSTRGHTETAPIKPGYHDEVTDRIERTLDWASDDLARITRLRLISDPGFPFWDVSYCHGVDTDGNPVDVSLPFSQLPKGNVSGAIIEHAKRDGVFAKGLGVFGAISTLQ